MVLNARSDLLFGLGCAGGWHLFQLSRRIWRDIVLRSHIGGLTDAKGGRVAGPFLRLRLLLERLHLGRQCARDHGCQQGPWNCLDRKAGALLANEEPRGSSCSGTLPSAVVKVVCTVMPRAKPRKASKNKIKRKSTWSLEMRQLPGVDNQNAKPHDMTSGRGPILS